MVVCVGLLVEYWFCCLCGYKSLVVVCLIAWFDALCGVFDCLCGYGVLLIVLITLTLLRWGGLMFGLVFCGVDGYNCDFGFGCLCWFDWLSVGGCV